MTPVGPQYPPIDEMQDFLRKQEWTSYQSKLGDNSIEMWRPPWEKDGGASLHLAYTLAKNQQQERLRKEAVEAGTAKVRCNKCGEMLAKYDKSADPPHADGKKHFVGYYGLVNTMYKTGFWSEHMPDCQRYIFSLCEKCIAEMFKTFKYEPDVEFEL